jgi:UDP-glucose 4-epimerase
MLSGGASSRRIHCKESEMACVLVTGGAGYIGSHTCVALLEAGHDIVVVDNLSNASPGVIGRIESLAGRAIRAFHQVDIRDGRATAEVFGAYRFDAVIHFAAFKSVAESVRDPLAYYDNNVAGTVSLLRAMRDAKVGNIVFSSSATVYGSPLAVPIREDFPLAPTNPYGWSKWMMERAFADMTVAEPGWSVIVLRYFNPVGAHPSGSLGECPRGVPNNLMPYVSQVAAGQLAELAVFGNDYPTRDGTGVRDYIHVVDLAEGHVRALERLGMAPALQTINLGTGRGYSVLELVAAFEAASGRRIPWRAAPRRVGDVAECWADVSLAAEVLGWTARRDLESMCADAWRWQSRNPYGYAE